MNYRNLAMTLIGLVVAATCLVCLAGQRVFLHASQRLAVVNDIANVPQSAEAAISELKPGDVVPVVRCVYSNKLYFPEIRLTDGRSGFVTHGNYTLVRTPVWQSFEGYVSFSC